MRLTTELTTPTLAALAIARSPTLLNTRVGEPRTATIGGNWSALNQITPGKLKIDPVPKVNRFTPTRSAPIFPALTKHQVTPAKHNLSQGTRGRSRRGAHPKLFCFARGNVLSGLGLRCKVLIIRERNGLNSWSGRNLLGLGLEHILDDTNPPDLDHFSEDSFSLLGLPCVEHG